ncbi:MAG: hypothetical protein EOM18_00680 [Clostridia bacterium]|nr:hypothetical protein [Clostridia bacterium]
MGESNRPIQIKENEKFVLANENGTIQVSFVEVLGQGGFGIAYKAIYHDKNAGQNRVCVVKEYFPVEDNWPNGIQYIRGKDNMVSILAPTTELKEQELERQRQNIKKEIEMTNRLFFDEETVNNNPHFYEMRELKRWGDTTYLYLDTEKGETLKSLVRKRDNGKMPLGEALRYTNILLRIVGKYFNGKEIYTHGDLKPENIWITDPGNAEGMVILDFGTAFAHSEFKKDIQDATDEEILAHADKIVENEGLGGSSEGYRNSLLLTLSKMKSSYIAYRSVSSAKKLIAAVNAIDTSVDVYSVLHVLFFLAMGTSFKANGEITAWDIEETTGENTIVSEWLLEIMKKNADGEYKSVEKVTNDLEILEKLLKKDADPRVILMKKEYERFCDSSFDEKLLTEVVEG